MQKTYRFIEDPGHGWLEVPAADVSAVGFNPSAYSPRRKGFVYLEEDCDAPGFLERARAAGWTVDHRTEYVQSFAR